MAPKPYSSFGAGLGAAYIKNKRKTQPVKPPIKPLIPPKSPPGPTVDPAEAEAERIVTEMLAELGYARDSARREAERNAQTEIARSQSLSNALRAMNMPGQVQGIYQNSGQSLAGLAQGFSSSLQGLANQQAAEQTNMVAGTGQEGAVRNQGANMGDVIYGAEGFIPARGLEQTGAAFASQAALEPGFALQFGNMAASDVMKKFVDEELSKFTDDEALIRSKKPGLIADARERKKQEVLQRYELGFATKRELAKALGVKDWRKYPNVTLQAESERPKASASLSNAAGYLIDEYGDPILDKKGKPIRLPKDPEKPWGSSTSGYWVSDGQGGYINILPPATQTKTSGGFFWEKDPSTGKWVKVGGSGPAAKGYQMKTLKDGSTVIFDPTTADWATVKPPPKGQGRKLTPQQRATARASATTFAQSAFEGFTDEDGNTFPALSLAEALEEIKKEPIPWSVARGILLNYYRKRGVNPRYNPAAKGPINPKGKPGRAGRINTSLVQEAGFTAQSEVVDTITQGARKYGLDPLAVMAVALAEGGLTYGASGDGGTSFGPFQLHVGGALPKGRDAAWANSPAGIDYALRKMSRAAKGLKGKAAIDAIVRKFERPADPDSEIERASGYYGKLTGSRTSSAQNVSYTGGGQASGVIEFASAQIGKPYVFGSGPSFESFDCSDLVQQAYKQIGINIPRTTFDQIKVGKPVKWGQFQPGDLVFTNKGGHVMLYIGGGKMISAPYTGSTVKIVDVSGYKNSFVTARRILNTADSFDGGSAYI